MSKVVQLNFFGYKDETNKKSYQVARKNVAYYGADGAQIQDLLTVLIGPSARPETVGALVSKGLLEMARMSEQDFMEYEGIGEAAAQRIVAAFAKEELIQSLQEGRLDAVFVDTSYIGESLWSCELFTESYYAVFPIHHRFRSRKSVETAELCHEPLIVHQAPCDTRKHIIEKMESLGYMLNVISELPSGDFILGAVAAGMGITIVPELMAKHIGLLQLFALPINDFGIRSISIATRNRNLGSQLYEFISTSVKSPFTK
ncbi:hypothetical protein BSNK01_04710 [Bacillaceae bacterium]